jgi:DNA-binding response OmpR family regulator
MSSLNPIILLLEDCPVTACLVERVILRELPDARLIWARTVAEARDRSAGLPISLFLIDIFLPDGCGLLFLEKAVAEHPSAAAIVITAAALPEHQFISEALGALHFIEKPLKIPVLLEQIRSALGAQNAGDSSKDFRAILQNVTPMDILQLKCLSGATTVVEFRSNFREGHIRFVKGEMVDALAGALRGVEAVRAIIGWPEGEVVEHGDGGEYERTIDCSWQTVLMEAAQAIDERWGESVAV